MLLAKQSFDREPNEYSLPKYLHIICRHVMPHCMLSCWWTTLILRINNYNTDVFVVPLNFKLLP